MLAPTAGEDHAYLISRVSFDDYVSYMTTFPVGAADMDRQQLAKEWRAANEAMKRLRKTEAGWADRVPIQPLARALEPLVSQVCADPFFHRAFADAPSEIGMVELDRIIASQKIVNMSLVRRLQEQLGREPSPEQVFRFCLPYDHPVTPCRAGRIAEREFAFVSDSCDLRFLDAVMLQPEQIADYRPRGPVAGVVGLVVGYGANYLSAVAVDGRLILINGNHRACTLHALGVRSVPCVVQKVPGPDMVDAMVPPAVRRHPDLYLKSPRPPVVKDYFNPVLSRIVPLPQSAREIRISYGYESKDVP